MVKKDSVFSEYFPEDKPVTAEKTIALELDKIEKPAAALFSTSYDRSVKSAVTTLSAVIAAGDWQKIKDYKWNLNLQLANNLWAEWLLGWQTGHKRGLAEINKISNEAIAHRADGGQPEFNSGFRAAKFNKNTEDKDKTIIRNRPAEKAIKARTNTLAKDVSDSEWAKIKDMILDAIKPQSATQDPISRKELLKRINAQLGDRQNKFKNRAEMIARTELTFAYNAGRLDSYVQSGLVAGVRYQTIFDERRCGICASRQGIIVALDDVEGLARLAIPTHPMCRCVWSPVLKEDFDKQSKQKGRQLKNRKLVSGKSWLAGAIIAAILLPEELIFGRLLAGGLALLIKKFGSLKLARAAIAAQINKIGNLGEAVKSKDNLNTSSSKATKGVQVGKIPPMVIAPGLDLQTATIAELRSLIPSLSQEQCRKILAKEKGRLKLKSLADLRDILDANQFAQIKAIARSNNILNLLHPNNNLNPSALWINSGGIISQDKAKVVFKLINNQSFSTVEELLEALKKTGVDIDELNNYSAQIFDRNFS